MNVAALTIGLYLAAVTTIGVWLGRASRDGADWATGGGTMGVVLIAAGIAGTRIGGVATYGVAGEVMHSGLWNLWFGVTTFLALALVGRFFAIPYRRLGLTTVSELFSVRFGNRRSCLLTSLCVQSEYLIINIIEPFVIGLIISSVTGLPLPMAIFVGAAVIISYTTASGLRGTAITNIIHCSVIVIGLAVVAWVVMQQMGGWDNVTTRASNAVTQAGVNPVQWWSIIGLGWMPIVAMFFSATIHTPAASIYVNYAASARRESILLPAFLLAGCIAAVMPMLSAVIGIEAVARYGVDSDIRSYAAITQVATDAGPVIGGIALAAILAALISSGGPILLASATLFVNDWLPSARSMSSRTRLRAYRVTSVVYGLVAATIAVVANISSVLELLLLAFALMVPPAVAIAYVLYWRPTTEQGAFWGIASGYGAGLMLWASNELMSAGPDPSYATTLVPLVVVPMVSLLTRRDSDPLAADFYQRLQAEN